MSPAQPESATPASQRRIQAGPELRGTIALLEAQALPTQDLVDADLSHFFFAGSPEAPVGLVGLELYGPNALLRSLVVMETERRRGLGAQLLERVETHAREQGVRSIYLLTLTAERFFAQRGYRVVERERAPPSIQRTREFASLCPASSAFLTKTL